MIIPTSIILIHNSKLTHLSDTMIVKEGNYMKYRIFNPKEDIQGNQKENVFIVMNEDGYLGNGYVYPKITSITPNHPINIFMGITLDDQYLDHKIGYELIRKLKKRAKELADATNLQALLYYGSEAIDEKTKFLYDQGFDVKLNTLKMVRSTAPIIHKVIPYDIKWEDHIHEDQEVVELHNKVLIKPITDDIIHDMSHKDDFRSVRVFNKGKLIATMMMFIEDNSGVIDHIVVEKNYKQKGIGTYLIAEAIDYFRKKLVTEITLEVWSANKGAISFYESLKFEESDVTEYYLGTFIL